ncbi:hypothetical protein MKO06_11765 [Gramella sp. GC03-9]|uniref:Uncharacterized protein n=1 Tax=Christiangramia oceanisediminis TaxID=2920386 RepID=A0A9X2RBQ4_9FLAO|nr:hypothetical protein [Gramella oceanisediminis]MCP9200590.1 hypothetical protein [Gramella oceanisediminis]
MIYLNYSDLNHEAKKRLLENSKWDVEQECGNDIRRYAKEHGFNFKRLIEEEALRNLHTYIYIFNI